ncbi:MAG: hypothetical protein K6T73_01120 [Candidatus Bathyarchaeota archaeon]|nr:hypothetical protein [Candidatus Bathyarchaeota archaeon]
MAEKEGLKKARLTVEDIIEKAEAKKDSKLLEGIAEKLPSASKVRIYKRQDDGGKSFIISIPAEDFPVQETHEFIKKKFVDKYGGGDYVVEMVDSGGDVVGKGLVNIIDESREAPEAKSMKIIGEALEMKERAIEKVREAEKEIREVEKTKYEATLDSINKQWEMLSRLYETKIKDLEERKKDQPEYMQLILNNQINSIRAEMDMARMKFESEMRAKEEGKVATEKMFDLVNTLIPLIVEKSTEKGKDPVQAFTDTLNAIDSVVGRKQDFFESLMENPEKLLVFKRLIGLDEDGRKKDFLSEMLENPAKAEIFKKVMGLDRKDFITEMMENPQKFEMIKKLMGVTEVDKTLPVTIEPKKDFLDQLIEAKGKYEALKSMFSPAQPVRSIVELAGLFFQNAGPHILNAINQITNSMVTMAMINKGLVTQLPDGTVVPKLQRPAIRRAKSEETPIEPFAGTSDKEEEKVDVRKIFENILIDVASSYTEPVESKIFVDKVAENVIIMAKRNPAMIFEGMKHKDYIGEMQSIISKALKIADVESRAVAQAIAEAVKQKVMQLWSQG